MDRDTMLVFAMIGIVIIVLGFIAFSWLTTPLNQSIKGDNTFFSLEECEKAGFLKNECFKLSPAQVKKVLREKNG